MWISYRWGRTVWGSGHRYLLCGTVNATTAGNLIDSMGTEVVQTDYTIRDLVPGEPLTYAEAVRRALEEGPR